MILSGRQLQEAFQHIGTKVAKIECATEEGDIREAAPKRLPFADVYQTLDVSVWPSSVKDTIVDHITQTRDPDADMHRNSEALIKSYFEHGADTLFGFLWKSETQRRTVESSATGELLRELNRIDLVSEDAAGKPAKALTSNASELHWPRMQGSVVQETAVWEKAAKDAAEARAVAEAAAKAKPAEAAAEAAVADEKAAAQAEDSKGTWLDETQVFPDFQFRPDSEKISAQKASKAEPIDVDDFKAVSDDVAKKAYCRPKRKTKAAAASPKESALSSQRGKASDPASDSTFSFGESKSCDAKSSNTGKLASVTSERRCGKGGDLSGGLSGARGSSGRIFGTGTGSTTGSTLSSAASNGGGIPGESRTPGKGSIMFGAQESTDSTGSVFGAPGSSGSKSGSTVFDASLARSGGNIHGASASNEKSGGGVFRVSSSSSIFGTSPATGDSTGDNSGSSIFGALSSSSGRSIFGAASRSSGFSILSAPAGSSGASENNIFGASSTSSGIFGRA